MLNSHDHIVIEAPNLLSVWNHLHNALIFLLLKSKTKLCMSRLLPEIKLLQLLNNHNFCMEVNQWVYSPHPVWATPWFVCIDFATFCIWTLFHFSFEEPKLLSRLLLCLIKTFSCHIWRPLEFSLLDNQVMCSTARLCCHLVLLICHLVLLICHFVLLIC